MLLLTDFYTHIFIRWLEAKLGGGGALFYLFLFMCYSFIIQGCGIEGILSMSKIFEQLRNHKINLWM